MRVDFVEMLSPAIPIPVFVFDLGFLYNSGVCVKMIGVGIEAFDGALDDVSEDGVPTPVDGVIGGRGRVVVCDKLRGFDFYSVGCAVFPWVDKVCLG